MLYPKLNSVSGSKTQAADVLSRLHNQQRRIIAAKNVASNPLKTVLERKSEMIARQIDRQKLR